MKPETCHEFIKQFESETTHTKTNKASDYGVVSFQEKNISASTDSVWKRLNHVLMTEAAYYQLEYQVTMQIPEYAWPLEAAMEESRMKKYSTNGYDRFDPHADVGNHATARRFLVMFWYLNDVIIGGETEFIFPDVNITVKPKEGRLLCFPPMWTHPHAGKAPISNAKYIVGTYLHFI